MRAHVLVVDDDPPLRRLICQQLGEAGYHVDEAASAEVALAQVTNRPPDLVVLDLVMPGMGGLAFIPEFRAVSRAPILVLSVVGNEDSKVAAIEAGADDYLDKPLGMRELLARIARHLARWVELRAGTAPAKGGAYRTSDGYLHVDPVKRTVVAGGQEVSLTALEFDLLAYLAQHADQVLTTRLLLQAVWQMTPTTPVPTTLRVLMHRLRQKLEPQPALPRYLHTVPAVGYRLRSTPG